MHQRRDGAVHYGENRPETFIYVRVVGGRHCGSGHLSDKGHLSGVKHARPHVLAGLGKGQCEVTDGAQMRWHVVGGDHHIDDLDHIQSIRE